MWLNDETPTSKGNDGMRHKTNKVWHMRTTTEEDSVAEYTLDTSSAVVIDMPQLPKPDFKEERRPKQYWKTYYEGLSLYKNGDYEEARSHFIKLMGYPNPHKSLYTDLLRTYRKIISKQIKQQEFEDAYKQFEECFNVCEDHITNTDRRSFNNVIDNLLLHNPDPAYQKLELVEKEIIPEFEMARPQQSGLTFVNEASVEWDRLFQSESKRRGSPERRQYRFVDRIQQGTVFVRSYYNEAESKFDKSYVLLRDRTHNIATEFSLDYGVYRFKAAENSDRFIASSDDMMLYLYSIDRGCLGTYRVEGMLPDEYTPISKYTLRCVDISPEGQFVLFTNDSRAWLLDSTMKLIVSFLPPEFRALVPPKLRTPREIRSRSPEYQHALDVLGLTGKATPEDMKKAFRAMILRYHPDRNRDDPRAHERTVEIIDAYEKLAGAKAEEAFSGLEDAEAYFIMVQEIKIDWIYATWLEPYAESIYLGYYSGKVQCVSEGGAVTKIYDCHDTIDSIRKRDRYLYIRTRYSVYVIEDDKCLAVIGMYGTGNERFDFRWTDHGFMLFTRKEVRIFSSKGIEIERVKFNSLIYDAYMLDKTLTIDTTHRYYNFVFN